MSQETQLRALNDRRVQLERERLMGRILTPEEEAEIEVAEHALNEADEAFRAPTIRRLKGMIKKLKGSQGETS